MELIAIAFVIGLMIPQPNWAKKLWATISSQFHERGEK